MEIEIKRSGLTNFDVEFRAVNQYRDEVIRATELAGKQAAAYMRTHAPHKTGNMANSVRMEDAVYRPGGAGGGGSWNVRVGIDEHQAHYAKWVIFGSGEHNTLGPRSRIYPPGGGAASFFGQKRTRGGRVFAFEKEGEGVIYTRWTKGQEPQYAWFAEAQQVARAALARNARSINIPSRGGGL